MGVLCLFLNSLSLAVRLSIGVYFLCYILSDSNKQIVRGLSDNIAYAISSFISAIGQILLIILLVYVFKKGLLGGIIAMAVAEFLSAVFIFYKGKIYQYIEIQYISITKIKEMLSYSWPIVPNTFSQSIMHTSDRFVISLFMGVASNGIYAAAYKIPSILAFAQATFNMAWQESATLTAKDSDVETYYSFMFKSLFNIVAGGMAFLMGITPMLFRILIKGDYQNGYNQIPILYMGILFYCLSSFWGGIFVAYKKTKVVATTTVIAALTNLLIDICTMKWIGLYAASISTLVSYITLCMLRLINAQKMLTIKYDVKHTIFVLSVLTIECILTFMQLRLVNVANLIIGTVLLLTLNWNVILLILSKLRIKCVTNITNTERK